MSTSHALARRLREVRFELYGEHGAPLLAKALTARRAKNVKLSYW